MFGLNLTNGGFGPVKRHGVLIVTVDEIINGLAQLLGRDETGPAERGAHQDTEPAFDLVQPTGTTGREVEVHVGMACQPAVVVGFVGTEVVQNA